MVSHQDPPPDQQPPSEWESLIRRSRAGCPEAMGQIADQVFDYLWRVADQEMGSHLRRRLGASDVVQHSLLEAQHGFARFDGITKAEVLRWLRRILLNNLADEARRVKTKTISLSEELLADGQIASTPVESQFDNASDDDLQRAISILSAKQRYVIERRHRDGWSYEKISRQMKTPEATVRKICSRGISQLRTSISMMNA